MTKLVKTSEKCHEQQQYLYLGRLLPDPDESNPSLSMTQPKQLESKAEQSLSKIKDLFKLELLIRLLNAI